MAEKRYIVVLRDGRGIHKRECNDLIEAARLYTTAQAAGIARELRICKIDDNGRETIKGVRSVNFRQER